MVAAFAAIGPLVAGLLYDLTGSYQSTWLLLMVAFAAAAGVILLARRPSPAGVDPVRPGA